MTNDHGTYSSTGNRGSFTRWLAWASIVTLVGGVCALLVHYKPPLSEELEYRTWDWRLRAIAEPPGDTPIRIINIDQASIDYLANQEALVFPWPRGIYVPILNYLRKAGARAVAFDMVFLEPSSYGVEDDQTLAEVFDDELPVVSAVVLRREPTAEPPEDIARFVARQRALMARDRVVQVPEGSIEEFSGYSLPVAPLIERSHAFGDVEGAADSDGVYRRVKALGQNDVDGPVITLKLPFALFGLAFPGKSLDLTPFMDSSGKLPIRFLGPKATIPTESFANIFISWQNIEAGVPPAIPLERYRDTLVFIGTDAPALLDLRPTPLSPSFPGVELNATVLQNALDQSFIRRVEAPFHVLITLGVIAVIAFVVLFLRGVVVWGGVLGVGAGYGALAFTVANAGYWIPLAVPLAGILISLIAAFATQYFIEGRQHRFIRGAFRHYVSPAIIDRIVEDPSQLQLGGEKRELTIFFSDIAGFTTISEKLEAKNLVALLNEYLSAVTDIILASGGTVDKYVGDAVVAFWNAPISVPDHAARGVQAALQIQEALAELRPKFEREYGVVVRTRIGLHSGPVSVGNFGSTARFNYTVIGDAANLASRLEGANKYFGTEIMVSARTKELAPEAATYRCIGALKVVGKTQGVAVYEPLAQSHSLRDPNLLGHYHQALDMFEHKDLKGARAAFEALSNDVVARKYCERIRKETEHVGDTELERWDPLWNLTEK